MAEEKSVVKAYTILHFSDNSIEATDAGIEGSTQMNNLEIRQDIKELAWNLLLGEVKDAARQGAFEFYQALEAKAQEANAENKE